MRRWYFNLARELHMTVGQLLASISSEEITEWLALQQIEREELNEKIMMQALEREAEEGLARMSR